jgi:YHS domain-containing protein
MGILSRFFRFLFWTLLLSWGFWLLKRLWGAQGEEEQAAEEQQRNPSPASGGRRLVRDPQCGMHVAEELAVRVSTGSEVIHFCSEACRDQYLQQTQKLAANA